MMSKHEDHRTRIETAIINIIIMFTTTTTRV